MFSQLEMAPADPILGLTEAFKADPNPRKINLGVGVYQDENGRTPIFTSVKKAEATLLEAETSKGYLPMTGAADYAAAVQQLLFGAGHPLLNTKRLATAHTPGGTGALRVASDLVKAVRPQARFWVSDPTWANHKGIFAAADFEVQTYPYYDADARTLDFDAMAAALEKVPADDVVLLHACCHNPTGVDPTDEQWARLAQIAADRRFLLLVDFAYQGFAEGLDRDATGLRLLCEKAPEVLVASSYSKNFGLYNERVGALTLLAADDRDAQAALSHLKLAVRRNYSNPPAHGGAIVSTIVNAPELRREWEDEVTAIRERIHDMRRLFVETLSAKGVTRDFSFITRQNGMFSFSGLTKEQVDTLREQYSIYIVGSGRINVAGLTRGNMDRVCQAIADVL